MPEEDDEALGQMLGDRLKETKEETQQDEPAGAETSDGQSESTQPAEADETASESTESAQPEPEAGAADDDSSSAATEGTVRSRSPFPLYVTPDLKRAVQNRFQKFNAQRTLNDEPQVEKHKHFMEGLLRAGLDHEELEEYVLEEFEND